MKIDIKEGIMSNLLADTPLTLPQEHIEQTEYHNHKTDCIVSMTENYLTRFLTKEEEKAVRLAVQLERICDYTEAITDEENEKYYSHLPLLKRKLWTKKALDERFRYPFLSTTTY